MDLLLAGIYDRSIDAYTSVQPFRADGEAVRSFIDAINNPNSGPLHNHPDDFDLFVVATFNTSNGHVTPETPRKIADGKQIKLSQEN